MHNLIFCTTKLQAFPPLLQSHSDLVFGYISFIMQILLSVVALTGFFGAKHLADSVITCQMLQQNLTASWKRVYI